MKLKCQNDWITSLHHLMMWCIICKESIPKSCQWHRWEGKRFALQNDQLMVNLNGKLLRCILTLCEQEFLLKGFHEGLGKTKEAIALSAHQGCDHMEHLLREHYFWYNMRDDIVKYVKTCEPCQCINLKLPVEMPSLQNITVPTAAFKQVCIDLIGLLTSTVATSMPLSLQTILQNGQKLLHWRIKQQIALYNSFFCAFANMDALKFR